jgi:hypothetical protein
MKRSTKRALLSIVVGGLLSSFLEDIAAKAAEETSDGSILRSRTLHAGVGVVNQRLRQAERRLPPGEALTIQQVRKFSNYYRGALAARRRQG